LGLEVEQPGAAMSVVLGAGRTHPTDFLLRRCAGSATITTMEQESCARVARVRIWAATPEGKVVVEGTTDEDGICTLRNLPLGKYLLGADPITIEDGRRLRPVGTASAISIGSTAPAYGTLWLSDAVQAPQKSAPTVTVTG